MSLIPKLRDFDHIEKVTVNSNHSTKTYYGDEARVIAYNNAQNTGGVFWLAVIGFVGYLFFKFVVTPYYAAMEYLGQFTVQATSGGLSYASIPAFIKLAFISSIAYFLVWSISFFNKFPDYASRAIIAIFIGFLFYARSGNGFYDVLGPIQLGYDDPVYIILTFLAYGLVSWIYFICARFMRFRVKNLGRPKNLKFLAKYKEPADVAREKIAITAFLNRRVNRGFLWLLLLVAVFDPNFWPDIPFETRFWSGTEYNSLYEPIENQYYANLDATPSDIIHTVATYLFIVFLVITLQVRSALSMQWNVGYAGYIPPHYVYGLALLGAFCASVFAFAPFAYIGDESLLLQAIPPILFIGVSLFITCWQYSRFLKLVEANRVA